VKDFDTSTHQTYTEEQPNSLTPDEVPAFLARMRELYPQHFAFVAMDSPRGFVRRRCVRFVGAAKRRMFSGVKESFSFAGHTRANRK
jgi:hypothetical protein